MSESLPLISWDDQSRLVSLVQAAVRVGDLDVRPVRVWAGVAECGDHGRIAAEQTLDAAATPTDSLKCALCAIRQWVSPWKSTTWRVLRG